MACDIDGHLQESRSEAMGAGHFLQDVGPDGGVRAHEDAFFAGKLEPNYIQLLEGTAPLHDVGMIGLLDYIFLKPGKLSDDIEYLSYIASP